MSDKRLCSTKVSLGMLKGKPVSTSVPTFRFQAGGDEVEQIYPEITEENSDKELRNDTPSENSAEGNSLSIVAPVPPPRSPRNNRSPKHTSHSEVPSAEVSPVRGSQSTGSLSKRSSSMDTGIGDTPAGSSAGSGWGLFTDIRGKIVRTVGEIKSERQARSEAKLNLTAKKDNASFSDSEEASSSESNPVASNNLSTSDSVSQLSNMSSLSTTPTTPSNMPVTKNTSKSEKWHNKILVHNEEDRNKAIKISTPHKSEKVKIRAASDPTGAESSSGHPQKRSSSLRSRFKPKICELRNRRKKTTIDSISNSSLSSVVYSVDGDETDEDELEGDLVESGIEALETWEEIEHTPHSPLIPLGEMLSSVQEEKQSVQIYPLKKMLLSHKYSLMLVLALLVYLCSPSRGILHVLIGALTVLAVKELKTLFSPLGDDTDDMHMGNRKFFVPDYNKQPFLQGHTVKEVLPTDSFHGWMNELFWTYDTKTYHISMTESVHARLDGYNLTLCHTRTKVPKRAMWNEPPVRRAILTDERCFDLRGWEVKLLPEGLTRSRQWSKKYPICLIKKDAEDETVSANEHLMEEDSTSKKEEKKRDFNSQSLLTTAKYAKSSLSSDSLDTLQQGVDSNAKDQDEKKSKKNDSKADKDGDSDFSDAEDDDSFCVISSETAQNCQNCLYLFARADREKEEWYRRFAEATRDQDPDNSPETDSSPQLNTEPSSLTPKQAMETMADYLQYMQYFQLEHKMYPPKQKHKVPEKEEKSTKESDRDKEKDKDRDKESDKEIDSMIFAMEEKALKMEFPMGWLNALIGRVCFDVLHSSVWKERIHQRLQKKLSTLKLPYFMETLTITEMDLGHTVPILHRASQPTLDVRGLWVELDVTYEGTFRMNIESKINLMRMKRNAPQDVAMPGSGGLQTSVPVPESAPADLPGVSSSRSPAFDSDIDDTAESSSDDDHSFNTEDRSQLLTATATTGKRAGKKLLRMVDKIAASKYFQQATEMKYIKRAMEGVNTRVMLSVELKGLVGTLAVNIPPPPSDRLWFGFHGNPKLWLSARPTVGDRQVNFHHISNWIEQKLCQEFQKVLVLPNMYDLLIPVMTSEMPV